MPDVITVSVRSLVGLVMRSGSIDDRFRGFDSAVEGTRIHRRLQKEGGVNYRPEVPLTLEIHRKNYTVVITGKADGIITESDGTVIIDEIKSTDLSPDTVDISRSSIHWAQAECYAYMYCAREKLDKASVRLTYFQTGTNEIRRYIRSLRFDELCVSFDKLLQGYLAWSDAWNEWQCIRNESISRLEFPFDSYRKGQRRLAASVYNAIAGGERLFCQAPTGTGKTVSVLFPAVKALAEGIADKIFYLTARTVTRQAAENTCRMFRDSGSRLRTVTLTAKDKICFLGERSCDPESCPYANGHYDRINNAIFEILRSTEDLTRDVIEKNALEYRLCPFELSLDLTLWSDCIISDYNYVFDPRVFLKRFFTEYTGEYIFLIDEAHNLTDRAREMFSAQLQKSLFLKVYRQLDKKDSIRRTVFRINKAMAAIRRECTDKGYVKRQSYDTSLHTLLLSFTDECGQWLRQHPYSPQGEDLLGLFFEVSSYLKIAELYDEGYITLAESVRNDVCIRLFCLDPSRLLDEAMKRARSSIMFSATLEPMRYYISVLGGACDSKRLLLPSPFPRENLCVLRACHISTKYRDRDKSIDDIAEYIAVTAGCRKGNYIAYFPSYAYMRSVYDAFVKNFPGYVTVIQRAGMTESEREIFLSRFQADNSDTLIGFCVLGGIYSESVDLKGERLIGTVIAGVGLPQINPEQEAIREYHDRSDKTGFAFAYRYPGMNKVMQAAGRVIRSENDRGVVLLIGSRYASSEYRSLLPEHWIGSQQVGNTDELREEVETFWKGHETITLSEGDRI